MSERPFQFSMRTLFSAAVYVCVMAWFLTGSAAAYPNDTSAIVFFVSFWTIMGWLVGKAADRAFFGMVAGTSLGVGIVLTIRMLSSH